MCLEWEIRRPVSRLGRTTLVSLVVREGRGGVAPRNVCSFPHSIKMVGTQNYLWVCFKNTTTTTTVNWRRWHGPLSINRIMYIHIHMDTWNRVHGCGCGMWTRMRGRRTAVGIAGMVVTFAVATAHSFCSIYGHVFCLNLLFYRELIILEGKQNKYESWLE